MSNVKMWRSLQINEEFLFCQPLETTLKAANVFQVLFDFFDKTKFGAMIGAKPTMIGANSRLVSLVKQKNPAIQGTHCMIPKEALVPKTIPKRPHEHLSVVIKVVNYCKKFSAQHTTLQQGLQRYGCQSYYAFISHSSLLALKKEHALSYSQTKRSQVVFGRKTKSDLLLAFGGDKFSAYLAYLADIFETLNQLNKKLQGPGKNIIVHTDAINAFVAKLKLWSQRANNDNFASFYRLTDITGHGFEQNLKEDIISHLQNLQNEFERYFPEINTFSILMNVARNSFLCTVKWKMFLKQFKKNL